ncbi:OmpA family protein [Jeongeupia sp. HS-3]|uniref:OmpA family protein n=1 Tax=Jeongeupia sp. HS-3 TaxID=1009682 RepID=UPI001910372E|nr:OmpA family protein [Jeongeupia sp. HS-3]
MPDGSPGPGSALKEAFWSDDPCSNNARNIGMALGVVGGALLGKAIGDGKTGAMFGGAAIGLLIGGVIGHSMDNRRCELAKIAKANQLDLQYAPIDASGETLDQGQAPADERAIVGMSVNVRDALGDNEQFISGSDQLTPRAKSYFAQIAKQYNPQLEARALPEVKRKDYLASMQARKILLIGHTDDTGASSLNADLSERRARAVARVLRDNGVPTDHLYYQGAGETLPIAGNGDAAGRAHNRRVEIVDMLGGEDGFKRYLEARQPKYQYYRTAQTSDDAAGGSREIGKGAAAPQTAKVNTPSGRSGKPVSGVKQSDPAIHAASVVKPDVQPKSTTTASIDFGGQPMTRANQALALGPVAQDDPGFSLIGKAYAADSPLVGSCSQDRPRQAGSVRSLSDGKAYQVSDHMPGLYNTTWVDKVNGHTIVLNKVSVLRADARVDSQPEFKVYADYDPGKNRNPKPSVDLRPQVNTYKGKNGVLYRVFTQGKGGITCVDLLFPGTGGKVAKSGLLAYANQGRPYVASIQPKILN